MFFIIFKYDSILSNHFHPYQTVQFFTITEQKSSNDIFPSALLSAFSSIILSVQSSRFYFTCLFTSRKSLMSMQFLLVLSYFLNIDDIYFLFSLRYGFAPTAFKNSAKLIPPQPVQSYYAINSQTVFFLGPNPF